MKIFLSLATAAFVLLASAPAQASGKVDIRSGGDLVVTDTHLSAAPGGGTYVSGVSRSALGVSAPNQPHVHITVYDRKGGILLEKIDTLNRDDLATSHYHSHPRATYTVYLPVDVSEIGGITISPHTGHHHTTAKNLTVS